MLKNPYYTGLEDFWHNPASVAQAGAGVASLGADIYGMGQQNLGLNNATYTQAANARPQGATGGEILGSGTKGAQVGLAIGGPVGAGVGAVVGAGAGLIGGAIRKKRQTNERNKALDQAAIGQQQDNQISNSYRNQGLQRQSYNNSMNNYNREYNVYSTRF